MDKPTFDIVPTREIRTVPQAVNYIRTYKITRQAAFFGLDKGNNSQKLQQNFVKPSGPRQFGEGVEDGEQGIIAIDIQEEDTAGYKICITLTQLIGGFIIGPSGISVRDLMRRTRCHVKSSTENASLKCPRRTRIFYLEGSEDTVLKCLDVLLAAVDRYKDLAEGKLQGHHVNRIQLIKGYIFYYYPPPKSTVPNAAGIKGLPPSKREKIRKMGFSAAGSHVAFLEPICSQITKHDGRGPALAEHIRQVLQLPEEEMDDVGTQYGGLFPDKNYDREMSIQMPNGEELDVNSPTAVQDLKYTIEVQEGFVLPDENGQPPVPRSNQNPLADIPATLAMPSFHPHIPTTQLPPANQLQQAYHGQPMYPQHVSPQPPTHLPPSLSPVGRSPPIRETINVQDLLNEAERMSQVLSNDVAILNKMLDELSNNKSNSTPMTAYSMGQLLDQQPAMTFNNAMLDIDFLPSLQNDRLDFAVPLGRQVAKNASVSREAEVPSVPVTMPVAANQFALNQTPVADFGDARGAPATAATVTTDNVLSIEDICNRLTALIEANSLNQVATNMDQSAVSRAAAVLASEGFSFRDSSTPPPRDNL